MLQFILRHVFVRVGYEFVNASSTVRVTAMENVATRMASFNGSKNRDTDQQKGGLLIPKMP